MSVMLESEPEISFLVYRGDQQSGPYTQDQLLAMLQQGTLGKKDLVYYEGLGEWRPLDEVFEVEEQLSFLMNEGQETEVVVDIYRQIEPMLTHDEQVYYIGHQRRKIMRQRPDAAVITNHRFIVVRQTLTGTTVEDCLWRNVISVQMKESLMGTTFLVQDRNDRLVEVEDLPKEQVARLCQLAQEMRE